MSEDVKKLYRRPKHGMIAGVAAGFAEYFNIDVTLMRIIFVVLAFVTGGAAIIVYIVFAIVMPIDPTEKDTPGTSKDSKSDKDPVDEPSGIMRDKRAGVANYFGIVLIIVGIWVLLSEVFPEIRWFRWELVWPAALVVAGVWLIIRSRKS